jgi:hypothetical protein
VPEDAFGQIRPGQEPGQHRQRGQQAEAVDAGELGHAAAGAAERPHAAAGEAAEPVFEPAERGRGVGRCEGVEQAEPQAGVGPAAEQAEQGLGLAVLFGQIPPGAVGEGVAEHGIEPGAGIAQGAAGGARHIG